MPKKIKPISVDAAQDLITNCFGFSVGDTTPTKKGDTRYDLNNRLPIAEAFLEKLTKLDYELPRQIHSVEESLENEYILMVFDFTPYREYHPFMGWMTFWDYHVVRRELNGTWVHKPGWHEAPCKIEEHDWKTLYEEFGRNFVLFAFAE